MQHFNALTPAQAERLAIIAEEAAEVIQAVTKIQRHGFDSRHPNGGPDNREMLENELGDLHTAVRMAVESGDIDPLCIDTAAKKKVLTVGRYLHHAKSPVQA